MLYDYNLNGKTFDSGQTTLQTKKKIVTLNFITFSQITQTFYFFFNKYQ